MPKKRFTILIVPENSAKVRRVQLSYNWLIRGAFIGALALSGLTFGTVHYLYMQDQVSQNSVLKEDNFVLETKLRALDEELNLIEKNLGKIESFAAKLRTITRLNDPSRRLAIGPITEEQGEASLREVLYVPGERIDFEDELLDSKLAQGLIENKAERVQREATEQERSLRQLYGYFRPDFRQLTHLPSVRPVVSRLRTSRFGKRVDPYTNEKVMHKGVDIAAAHGARVVASGDGTVIFVGSRGGYGKTLVVDHGFGFQTHYSHLSSYGVTVGQKIKRGGVIGMVGNTGRSTGPHLHYEVRLDGIPQDPELFFFK
ncbi:MAG: M23 family metallopeptidase [Myxococcota bacterium]|nr:M23 family metallopeptidase [Myxococcota bacterium]